MTTSAMALHVRHTHQGAHHTTTGQLTPSRPARPALPVDKHLVHRAHLRDVLPTHLTRHDDTHFTVCARWPREHRLFVACDGRYTASLVLETIRQTTLLISHAHLGVPVGHHFVMWDLSHRLDAALLQRGASPAEVSLDVTVTVLRRRAALPTGMRMEMTLKMDGRPVGSGSIRFDVTSPAAYTRIRGHIPPAPQPAVLPQPLDPRTVHHHHAQDVTLAPTTTPGQWQLRADPANDLLFDHANDHLPAMVLVEAAQQAAHLHTPGRPFTPSASEMRFTRYIEFHTPCLITTHPHTTPH
ncbi:ScbA/BarX family gamma-butyrolactone biosynthesis protein, partial [Streptomyces sp. NPDC005574]|uniref:ScbA/BarX family gamma-butyrolactone biosynthesis protein n=1 Tax=Streptomyces sp. NPDC005574 TaxID=3156891 RepID=UPI0033B95AB5